MEDLYEQFEDDLSQIDSEVGFPGEDLTEEEFEQLTDAERDALFNEGRTLTDDHKARLTELQEEEIDLAQVVSECGGGFDAQQDLFQEVVVEYEQQFLEDNADRLEGYGS